jgi:N-acetylmuramoyl-L-alanine amidase
MAAQIQGAVENCLREKDIALDIALRIRSILTNQYENIQVKGEQGR